MGGEQSAELPKQGFHILQNQVQPTSPGEKAGLVAFFDFIVAAQGVPMGREDSPFSDILKTNIGKEVKLVVYSTKNERTREAVIVPSDSWGGSGVAGISIRFCGFEHATEQVWHVLVRLFKFVELVKDVYPDSPASAAGLEARTDYIVGTPEILLSDSEDFFTLIGSNEGKSIPLYVYSTNTDNIRQVQITPNSRWGGTGSLGCDIGFGYLHRIPMNRNIPVASQVEAAQAVPGRPVPQLQPIPFQPAQPVHQYHPSTDGSFSPQIFLGQHAQNSTAQFGAPQLQYVPSVLPPQTQNTAPVLQYPPAPSGSPHKTDSSQDVVTAPQQPNFLQMPSQLTTQPPVQSFSVNE